MFFLRNLLWLLRSPLTSKTVFGGSNLALSSYRRQFEDPADHLVADSCVQEGFIGAEYGLEQANGMVAVPALASPQLVLLSRSSSLFLFMISALS